MKRIVVAPYKMGSASAKLLAKELDCLRVYPNGDYVPKSGDVIVNWGAGDWPMWSKYLNKGHTYLNNPDAVMNSVEKTRAFPLFQKEGVNVVPYTHSQEKAKKWLHEGQWVCCRTETQGMDGSGLFLAKKPGELQYAHLYTKYMPIAKEFRVYVFKGKVIDILEKRRDSEALAAGQVNPDIRTERNNWVFCRSAVHPANDKYKKQAVLATEALGLDFAGVDVIYGKDGEWYVLETNTAPGIYGTTVSLFADAIRSMAKN